MLIARDRMNESGLYPTVVTNKEEWEELTSKCMKVYNIVYALGYGSWSNDTVAPPIVAYMLDTDDPRYNDFMRVVVDDSNSYLRQEFDIVYALGRVYIHCLFKYTKPAILDIEFIIDVEEFMDGLEVSLPHKHIGLGFVNRAIMDGTEDMRGQFSVMSVPSIPAQCIVSASTLYNAKVLLDKGYVRDIIVQMVADTRSLDSIS